MPKPVNPMQIMNALGGAAHQKAQPKPDNDHDEDDLPKPIAKKSPKQAAMIAEKKKGNAKAPKLP